MAEKYNQGLSAEKSIQVKQKTTDGLLKIYSKYGLTIVKKRALGLLEKCEKSGDIPLAERQVIKGEIAEVMTLVEIYELQKRVYPSLCIKGLCFELDNGYTTEIDLVFFTSYKIYLFECKCYSGNKTLTDECKLHSEIKGKDGKILYASDMDINSQSKLHLEALRERLDRFYNGIVNEKNMPYQLVFIDGSKGKTKDLRTEEWKDRVPIVRTEEVHDWLEKQFSPSVRHRVQWNFDAMIPTLRRMSEESDRIFKQHIQ